MSEIITGLGRWDADIQVYNTHNTHHTHHTHTHYKKHIDRTKDKHQPKNTVP